ncbi:MAG: hypothetical protein R3E02_02745 [Blastomonas sp.]
MTDQFIKMKPEMADPRGTNAPYPETRATPERQKARNAIAADQAERRKAETNDEAEDAPRDKHNLDEGLEDSMDGSDPPSTLQP